MATATTKTREQMIEKLAQSQAIAIERAELVNGRRSESPVSVRLSAPLLEALDRLAQKEHRKRGNLIQHILSQIFPDEMTALAVRSSGRTRIGVRLYRREPSAP